jgi:hypothetical protein
MIPVFDAFDVMSAAHVPLLVPQPDPYKLGLRDAYSVAPASIQSVTPDGRERGPLTNALFDPAVVRRTDCPLPHELSAVWIRVVSSAVSLGRVLPLAAA